MGQRGTVTDLKKIQNNNEVGELQEKKSIHKGNRLSGGVWNELELSSACCFERDSVFLRSWKTRRNERVKEYLSGIDECFELFCFR